MGCRPRRGPSLGPRSLRPGSRREQVAGLAWTGLSLRSAAGGVASGHLCATGLRGAVGGTQAHRGSSTAVGVQFSPGHPSDPRTGVSLGGVGACVSDEAQVPKARQVAKAGRRGSEGRRPPPGVLLKPTPTTLSPSRAWVSPGAGVKWAGAVVFTGGVRGLLRFLWSGAACSGSTWGGRVRGGQNASDSGGPIDREGGGAVLGSLGRGDAGWATAALVHVGVGVLEGRPVGTLHGHHLLVGPGLLAADARALRGPGPRGVPADTWPSGPAHLPQLPGSWFRDRKSVV